MLKLSNNLPVIGGAAMPVLTISFTNIGETIFYAAIGALTGYIVKILAEKLFKKLKILK